MDKKTWYSEGIFFECQGSGRCCTSHGEFGYVYFTEEDVAQAAKVLKISKDAFVAQYCQRVEGLLALKDNGTNPDCIFLKDKRCSIYKGRPTQCRTWPFWPEVMNAKKWRKSMETFCTGINKGRLYSAQEIDQILDIQKKSEQDIYSQGR